MSFNNAPSLAAGGNIYPCRYVKLSTSASHTGLQCGANEQPIAISGESILDARSDAENLYHATTTFPDRLKLRSFGDADVLLEVGTGGWTAGDLLESDADGKGVTAIGPGRKIGAVALQTIAYSAGAKGRVQILPTPGTGDGPVAAIAADGAITQKEGQLYITKTSLAALTIAAPTPTTDDGKTLHIVSTTPFAHTITLATVGFNSSGSTADVATFDGAVRGAAMTIRAYQGVWYTTSLRSVTLA